MPVLLRHRLTPTAAALLLAAAAASAQPVDALYSLGDSLSDAGTYAPTVQLLQPGAGRFTTNPGGVWTDALSQALGLADTPALANQGAAATRTPLGGHNYAQGGARVALTPGSGTGAGAWFTADPVSQQVDRLLADTGARLSSAALVTVWAGANDVFAQYAAVGGGLAVADARNQVGAAADALGAQVARLRAAGARLVVVNTLPDLGATPAGRAQGPAGAALLTQMSHDFNARLLHDLAGQNVLLFDTGRLLADVQARPAAYGFTAVDAATVPACAVPTALLCVNAPQAATRVFADDVHPTSAAHAVLAQALLATLRAPGQIAALAVLPAAALRQPARLLSPWPGSAEAGRGVGRWALVTDVQAGRTRTDAAGLAPEARGEGRTGSVAIDLQLLPQLRAGALLSQARLRGTFEAATGSFRARATTAGLYGVFEPGGGWRFDALLAQGQLDYGAIRRDAWLGATGLDVASIGTTTGRWRQMRLAASWRTTFGRWSGGPTLALSEERLRVDGYDEAAGPLSLSLGGVDDRARRLSLGVDGRYDTGTALRPYVRASVEHDLRATPLTVRVGSFAGALLPVDIARPDRTLGRLTLGLEGSAGAAARWQIGYSATVAQRGGAERAIGATLAWPL